MSADVEAKDFFTVDIWQSIDVHTIKDGLDSIKIAIEQDMVKLNTTVFYNLKFLIKQFKIYWRSVAQLYIIKKNFLRELNSNKNNNFMRSISITQ